MRFYKFQASGNDFILIQATGYRLQGTGLNYKKLAKKYCQRKFGIGADGLLVIEPSKKADFKMRIFNPDGSEPEMCGNGARCVAFWANLRLKTKDLRLKRFETKAGIIEAEVKSYKPKAQNKRSWQEVKIKMVEPFDLKLGLPIKVLGRKLKINYINTGVPHAVIFVEGLDKIDVENIGKALRFHKRFRPAGTNVDFVEVLSKDYIKVRTYERGVETETLACGTGVVASAITTSYKLPHGFFEQRGRQVPNSRFKIKVLTKSGDILRVYFRKDKDKIDNVWLEGKAYFVYKGELAHSKNAKRKEQSA